MLTHKSKSVKSKRHEKPKSIVSTKSKPKKIVSKKSLKTKGCHYSCSSSSSSSSSSCWSACSSNSYKSCSVSSDTCGSSSSCDSSCQSLDGKDLVLGNRYLTIGNDSLTIRFDPSQCNTLPAPTYQMGFGLANVVSGTTTNNVLLLGVNETTAPFLRVVPQYSLSGGLTAPLTSIDFPQVSSTLSNIDVNSTSSISHKQFRVSGNDSWTGASDNFGLLSVYSALGLYASSSFSTISNVISLGPENITFRGSVYAVTTNSYTCDFRNLVTNLSITGSTSTLDLKLDLAATTSTGATMLSNGDVRYINIINTTGGAITPNIPDTNPTTITGPPSIVRRYSVNGNPAGTITIQNGGSLQLKITVIETFTNNFYFNIQT